MILFVNKNSGVLFIRLLTIKSEIVGAINTFTTMTGDLVRLIWVTEVVQRVSLITARVDKRSKIDGD